MTMADSTVDNISTTLRSYCRHCGDALQKLHCCGLCESDSYCSVNHQTKDLAKHQIACDVIQNSERDMKQAELTDNAYYRTTFDRPSVTTSTTGKGIASMRNFERARMVYLKKMLAVGMYEATSITISYLDEMRTNPSRCTGEIQQAIFLLTLRLGQDAEYFAFLHWQLDSDMPLPSVSGSCMAHYADLLRWNKLTTAVSYLFGCHQRSVYLNSGSFNASKLG